MDNNKRTCETCFHYVLVHGAEPLCLYLFSNHEPKENNSDCQDWYPKEKNDPYNEK